MEEGFVACSKCNGRGTLNINETPFVCPKCFGDGKLDWVENVVGKDFNLKRVVDHINKSLNQSVSHLVIANVPRDSIVNSIIGFLNGLRGRKEFYNYYVCYKDNSDTVDISMALNITKR